MRSDGGRTKESPCRGICRRCSPSLPLPLQMRSTEGAREERLNCGNIKILSPLPPSLCLSRSALFGPFSARGPCWQMLSHPPGMWGPCLSTRPPSSFHLAEPPPSLPDRIWTVRTPTPKGSERSNFGHVRCTDQISPITIKSYKFAKNGANVATIPQVFRHNFYHLIRFSGNDKFEINGISAATVRPKSFSSKKL